MAQIPYEFATPGVNMRGKPKRTSTLWQQRSYDDYIASRSAEILAEDLLMRGVPKVRSVIHNSQVMMGNRPNRGGVQIIELDENNMPLSPEGTSLTVEDIEDDIDTVKLKELLMDERKERRIKKLLRGTLRQATERAIAWAEQKRLQEKVAQQSTFLMDESKKRQVKKVLRGNLKRGSDEPSAWIPVSVPVVQAGLHPSSGIEYCSPVIYGHTELNTSSKPVRKIK